MATAGRWQAINQVLEQHEMLLVHFNTPMKKYPIGYPNDLQYVTANPQIMICASTFGIKSTTPHPMVANKNAHCVGMVGLILDLPDTSTINGISDTDAGSNTFNGCPGLTFPPSVALATKAINRPDGHDEWVVTNADIKGVLVLDPCHITAFYNGQIGEYRISLNQPEYDLTGLRIFTIKYGFGFEEYDPTTRTWTPCTYNQII